MGVLLVIVLCVAAVCLALSPLRWLRRRRNRMAVEMMSGRWSETRSGESEPSAMLVFGPGNAGYRECDGRLETFAYEVRCRRLTISGSGRSMHYRMERTGASDEFLLLPCRCGKGPDREDGTLHIRRVAGW